MTFDKYDTDTCLSAFDYDVPIQRDSLETSHKRHI